MRQVCVDLYVPLAPSLGGSPPLQATASTTVFVNLQDLNDNDPTFLNLPFVAEVPEGLPIGSSVYKVNLTMHTCYYLNLFSIENTIYIFVISLLSRSK